MNEEELIFRLALHFLPGIGPVSARALISYCGGVENIFKKKKSQLEKIPGIGKERAELVFKSDLFEKAEKEIRYMTKAGIRPLFYLDKEYPARLKNYDDSPLMLFYKGNADLNAERIVSIVGTRFITSYGKEQTDKLVEGLSKFKVTIVSGLAYGVDIQSHKAALENNLPTIGVVAHGHDRIYPAENKPTAEKMFLNGGIISEYPSNTKPDRENFPARNRIVAAMSDALIVVESAERGGALITAEFANEYNKDVFALPGRVHDHFSKGCNQLIRKNKAVLIEHADQVAEMMQWEEKGIKEKKASQLDMFRIYTAEEKLVIDILKEGGQSGIDAIMRKAGITVSKVSATLLNLEFAGILRSLPGKMYELI